MFTKKQVIDLITEKLFDNDLNDILENIAGLITEIEPNTLSHLGIYYKGKEYNNCYPINSNKITCNIKNIDIPENFISKLDSLIQEKEELEKDKQIVLSYLRTAYNISEEATELLGLIDPRLYNSMLNAYHPWIKADATPEQIKKFKKATKNSNNTIKKRLLINLLKNKI